jgi:hypothetical protein
MSIPDGWLDLECDLHSAVLTACERNGLERQLARKIASDAVIAWRRKRANRTGPAYKHTAAAHLQG